MQHKAAFLSTHNEWSTPQGFFDAWNGRFQFDMDVAATAENAKVPEFYTIKDDALTKRWLGNVSCNPPYGRTIGDWVEKAYRESRLGAVVVLLIPARTETQWWHGFVTKAAEIHFVAGRLRFGGSKQNAPFPSCVVVFDRFHEGDPDVYWGGLPQ